MQSVCQSAINLSSSNFDNKTSQPENSLQTILIIPTDFVRAAKPSRLAAYLKKLVLVFMVIDESWIYCEQMLFKTH